MTTLRRSARSHKAVYKETSDSENDSEPSSDYEEPNPKTNKRGSKPKAVAKGKKRAKSDSSFKTSKRANRANLEQLEAELPENHLYQALAQPEIDTSDLALEWIEAYIEDEEEEKNDTLTSLINLVLRSCGSVHLFEPHDLVNLESAAETVGELTIAFGSQKAHKYPFKALPTFKKNVLAFFEHIITILHEKGLLYKYDDTDDEYLSSPLMTQVLTWISSLSSCTIRPLRYISTLILLTIQNQLCHIINTVVSTLDKAQRQLSRATKKNKSNLSATVQSYQNQKNTILEYFSEIGNITLGHRYRDVDPTIRQECLRLLGQSMVVYPDHFFQASFLRYYGWLLSDPTHSVRLEATKVLLKLYKNSSSGTNVNNVSIGFRQFTERYKEQLIKMNKLDSDVNVRLNTISICCELLKIGFLSESDCNEVISIFFELVEGDSSKSISKTNLHKTKQEIGKFISILNKSNTKAQLERYAIFIDRYESEQFGTGEDKLQIEDCLRVKDLIQLLKNASLYREGQIINDSLVSQIFNVVYQLPLYEDSWEFLVKYFLLDPYSITFSPKDEELENDNVEVQEFKELLDLSKEDDRAYFLNFIDGAITSLLSKKQEISTELVKLANYLPSIQSISMKSDQQLSIFVNFWNQLISVEDESDNIFSVFKGLGQLEVYNDITTNLLKSYQSLENGATPGFEGFFAKLLANYESISGTNILTPEVKIEVQNLVEELIAESRDILQSDASDSEETDNDLSVQKKIIGDVIELSRPLDKLYKLGDHIDLNLFLKNTGSQPVLELILQKVFGRLNIELVVERWASNFLSQSEKFIDGFRTLLDLFLIVSSWKLEKLIYIVDEAAQAEHDIVVLFKEVDQLLGMMVQTYDGFTKSISYVLENELTSRFLIIKRISELRTLFAVKFIDFITSVKIFYVKVKDKNSFRNFDRFFNYEESSGFKYVVKGVPEALELQLLNLFLYKEAQLGSILGLDLERTDEEDVNIEELISGEELEISQDGEIPQTSVFDSDGEEEEDENRRQLVEQQKKSALELKKVQAKQKKTWAFEKELCVYTLKLFSLIDMNMASEGLVVRIRLNESRIGGVFSRIVKQHKSSETVSEELEQEQEQEKRIDEEEEPLGQSLEPSEPAQVET